MKSPEFYQGREQTYVKHFFLEKYLERVAYNIFSFRDEFVYVDGFSGPWKSTSEAFEDTSFVIALNQLRKVRDGLMQRGKNVKLRCLFNDNDPVAHESLKKTKQSFPDIDIKVLCRDFEEVVPDIVEYVGRSFSLTFIDPTGWTGFGLEKIRPLLALPGEVIINFMFDYVNRFLEDPRPEIARTLDPLFGGPKWDLQVENRVEAGATREDAILAVYCQRLREIGQFQHVTTTRILKPLADRSFFHLVYGTRHWKGLVEFRAVEKTAVDKQERVRGTARITHKVQKSGQRDLFGSQGDLLGPRSFGDERRKRLDAGHQLVHHLLASRGSLKYESLLGLVLEIPMVWESDIKDWLRDLRSSGQIEIPQLTGRANTPRRGHTIEWLGRAK